MLRDQLANQRHGRIAFARGAEDDFVGIALKLECRAQGQLIVMIDTADGPHNADRRRFRFAALFAREHADECESDGNEMYCRRQGAKDQCRRRQSGHRASVAKPIAEFQDLMKFQRRIGDGRMTGVRVRTRRGERGSSQPAGGLFVKRV